MICWKFSKEKKRILLARAVLDILVVEKITNL